MLSSDLDGIVLAGELILGYKVGKAALRQYVCAQSVSVELPFALLISDPMDSGIRSSQSSSMPTKEQKSDAQVELTHASHDVLHSNLDAQEGEQKVTIGSIVTVTVSRQVFGRAENFQLTTESLRLSAQTTSVKRSTSLGRVFLVNQLSLWLAAKIRPSG